MRGRRRREGGTTTTRPIPTVREYRVWLSVDLDARTFRGRVSVDLAVPEEPLRLDASGLEVTGVRVDGEPVPFALRPETEALEVSHVGPGPRTVEVEYRGRATQRGLIGLYESRFGAEHILTTQCAPTGAHRVFPCIDRPDRKAPIRLTLEVAQGLTAISNTPIERESTAAGVTTLTFAPTPPMATYLFYLGIGRFEALRGPPGRVQITVFAPPGRSGSGQVALDYASRLLPAFERYFGIDYPLPKLDLVAVPQYAYGAMENWGAIVFRDMYLLIDPATTTRNRRYALDTVAHELAHQWFGNLVTMAWWDDIWLNESFATFLEMRLFERVEPSYGSLENYLAFWVPRAILSDSLPYTHPVTARVEDPSEIPQVFDDISYGKGSAILRMIEAYLGEEAFRQGVSEYLDRFRYANATSRDLWDAFDRQGPEPVRPLLEVWTERPGHPLLRVERVGEELALHQRRFALDGRHGAEHWPVPLTYEVDGKLHRRQLVEPVTRLPIPRGSTYHLNPGAVGFYRVLYDDEGYDQLLRTGASRPATDRWCVLRDLDAFLYSGDAPFSRFGAFVRAEAGSRDHLPVRLSADTWLEHWFVLGEADPSRHDGLDLLVRQFERLGPRRHKGEPDTDGILRERVATALAWGDPSGARRLVESYPDPTTVDADLRGAVTTALARLGDATTYETLLRHLRGLAAEGPSLDYELALASFRRPELIERTLAMVSDRTLNRAHLPELARRLSWNPEGREGLWGWMQHELPQVAEETRGTGFASYVLEYGIPFVGLTHEPELRAWLEAHPVAEGARGARKGIGLLEANRALRRRVSGARGG